MQMPKLILGRCAEPTREKALNQGTFRVVPPKVQIFSLISQNLKKCKTTHSSCSPRNQESSLPTEMRVTNCLSRRVISAPESCHYLALSYVWENEKCAEHQENQPLFTLPQTIEDAIAVTLDLQFQYLWVDMYCIKQNDVFDFHTQIRQMDRIYRGAEITIVAAAGTGPSEGLPGVSSERQSKQAHATIDGVNVATLFDQPWDEVRSSQWHSRA